MKKTIKIKNDRLSSISFTRGPHNSLNDEEIQLSLAPYIESYITQNSSQTGWSCLPMPFERAAPYAWIRPSFDSDVLEGQFKRSSFSQITLRFRYGLLYILLVYISWIIYIITQNITSSVVNLGISFTICTLVSIFIILTYYLTYKDVYRRYINMISFTVAITLSLLLLTFALLDENTKNLTPISYFTNLIQIIMLIYTVIPLPVYLSVIICSLLSMLYEVFVCSFYTRSNGFYLGLCIRVLCHVCTHVIGLHILVMTTVRMRGTFMKVGQSLLVRRQLEMEKQLKERMIKSVMPPKVANWLLDDENKEIFHRQSMVRTVNNNPNDLSSMFRPFNMATMDNVSILFADIVGFTRMCSNKTAEEIVGILNDLFERFDDLCLRNGCEKISTLGDCYYCVSGCPEPRTDHAKCCVEMGLGMIRAIRQFDIEHGEDVNMRVGVHTGTVLCGIVGTRRFKFDVWSNDVTLANKLESTGQPGRVHISQQTADYLSNYYELEDNSGTLPGVKSFLIKHVDPRVTVSPPASPRPRLMTTCTSTCDDSRDVPKKSHCLSLITKLKAKAYSLPSVLDEQNRTNMVTTPLVSSSSNKLHSSRFSFTKCLKPKDQTEIMPSVEVSDVEERDCSISVCEALSVNSRKDSGIRTNSRRSSIQQQLFLMNGSVNKETSENRVSGYYTSSQSSLPQPSSFLSDECIESRYNKLRKQSDLQLIRCVQHDSKNNYFVQVPINKYTLFFNQAEMEQEFRNNTHKMNDQILPGQIQSRPTLATTRYNTYLDIVVSGIVLSCTVISLFLLPDSPITYIIASVISLIIHFIALLLSWFNLIKIQNYKLNIAKSIFTKWYPWHAFGSVLVSLPSLLILISYCLNSDYYVNFYYSYLILIGLVHFCNFTQLNCWLKSFLAIIFGFVYLISTACKIVHVDHLNELNSTLNSSISEFNSTFNSSINRDSIGEFNSTWIFAHRDTSYKHEIFLNIILILILVLFLNREFEINYRSSFHGNVVSNKDKAHVQNMKNQADWLLHNIIPKYVADQLKTNAKYSENHKNVGIMFASVVNFHQLYDESYSGGKEYLRVLNELIGDFDELLNLTQYKNVEKIKTIGSTFMAASGLNPEIRKNNSHPNEHLFELMQFAHDMYNVINRFNTDLLGFNLVLRVGYNVGDVTSGVIGSSKLFYDIWGDAVNIASRMDSTGVQGRIQIPESCLSALSSRYEFEQRGSVYVKGKGDILVYLLKSSTRESTPG